MALTFRWFAPGPFPPSRTDVEIKSDGICDGPHFEWSEEEQRNVAEPPATLAHVGFEIVAQVLAAPLRKAYAEHLGNPAAQAEHKRLGGLAYCYECKRLARLLPEGDNPVVWG